MRMWPQTDGWASDESSHLHPRCCRHSIVTPSHHAVEKGVRRVRGEGYASRGDLKNMWLVIVNQEDRATVK